MIGNVSYSMLWTAPLRVGIYLKDTFALPEIVSLIGQVLILLFMGLGFLFLLNLIVIKDENTKCSRDRNTDKNKNCQLIHYLTSSVSIFKPIEINSIDQKIPATKLIKLTFPGLLYLPMTKAINIAWPKFKSTFEMFSLCFLAIFIFNRNYSAINEFVKGKGWLLGGKAA